MFISVCICTWNRAELLDQTLSALRDLDICEGHEWELLIVNNNCSDQTDEVIYRHASYLPIRRLFEVNQGHSNSRNRALEAARGEIILWTDDDVIVNKNWAMEYVNAAGMWPEAAFFGGPIDPWFEVKPPPWIIQNFELLSTAWAAIDMGPEVRMLIDSELPFGANMAYRMSMVGQHRYNPLTGRVGRGMLSGDETDYFEKLIANGSKGVWVGTSRVKHNIPKSRLSLNYISGYFMGMGRMHVRRHRVENGRKLLGIPLWLLRKHLIELFLSMALRPLKNPRWVRSFKSSAIYKGMILELLSQWLLRARNPS